MYYASLKYRKKASSRIVVQLLASSKYSQYTWWNIKTGLLLLLSSDSSKFSVTGRWRPEVVRPLRNCGSEFLTASRLSTRLQLEPSSFSTSLGITSTFGKTFGVFLYSSNRYNIILLNLENVNFILMIACRFQRKSAEK